MQGKGAGHDKHGGGVNVLEGQVSDKLRLDDGADVGEVCTEMMHVADSHAGRDGCLDLAEVLLGFAEEPFCFAIIRGSLLLLCKGLGVGDEIKVAEALLALAGEFDGLH